MNCAMDKTSGRVAKPVPEQYAGKPNLWRVACELSTFKYPYRAADALLAVADTVSGNVESGECGA